MTTAPAKPRFTTDARGHYPCPAPTCQQAFTRSQGVSRHWNQQHGDRAATAEPDPYDLDNLRALADEVQAEKDDEIARQTDAAYAERDDDTETPPAEATAPHGADDAGVEGPGEAVSDPPAAPARPGTPCCSAVMDNGVQLLTAQEVIDRACQTGDVVLALSDAVVGLTDAITRLVAIGYDRVDARDIVIELIAKLDERPAA